MNLRFPDKTQYPAVGLAVSGGEDSVAMLLWCFEHKAELPRMTVYTFDHRLRGKAGAEDAAFVAALAEKLGFPCRKFLLPVKEYAKRNKLSTEDAARFLRRSAYREAVLRGEISAMATAHHASDLAETVLFRLLRGTGVTGAAGILPESDGVFHPMLSVTKAEITAFLEERHAVFRTDVTNENNAYTRNFLRNEIIPQIKTRFPRGEEALARFAVLAKEDDELLQRLAKPYWKEDGTLLFTPEKPLFARAFIGAAKEAGLTEGYHARMIEEVFGLFSCRVGTKIQLIRGFYAERTRQGVRVFPPQNAAFSLPFVSGRQILPCGEVTIEKLPAETARAEILSNSGAKACAAKAPPGTGILPSDAAAVHEEGFPCQEKNPAEQAPAKTVRALYLSAEAVEKGAFFRNVRPGDRFQPFGHQSEKKLKDFLSARGLNSFEKARIAVLESGGKIAAVLPEEVAEWGRVSRNTENVYRFLIQTEKKTDVRRH